jgi:integrase
MTKEQASKAKAERKGGVTVAPWISDRYNWRVFYPNGGKRVVKCFVKKTGPDGADAFATKMRKEVEEQGTLIEHKVSPAERRSIQDFREEVAALPGKGGKATVEDALKFYLDSLKRRHKSIKISILIENLIDQVKRNGAGMRQVYTLQNRLNRFDAQYRDWLACDFNTEVIDEFLEDLRLAPRTTLHYRAALFQLFKYAQKRGAAELNPVEDAFKPKAGVSEIGFLKPKEVRALLAHATEEILAGLAIGFFAGVRKAELDRMDWNEIDFTQGHIEVTARKSKTASRRIIPMQANLRKWLQLHRKISGPIMPTEMVWRNRLADVMKAAELEEWPHNAPRHSFASYRLADTQDAPKVSLELGHDRPETLFEHYRALVTAQSAKAYWKIAPVSGKKIIRLKEARSA